MLYESWRQVSGECAGKMALTDMCTGRQWSFRELAEEAENLPPADNPVAFPSGVSARFVLEVLRAWRDGHPVCPLEPGQPMPQLTKPLPKEFVHLKTTSATTGVPRLVAFKASQLAADAANIRVTMGLRRDWPNLGVISLAHSYGFSNLVLPLLLQGIPLVLVGSALPEALRRAAAHYRAVTLAAVPALWRTWHEAHAIPSNVRLAISAGAPLPLPVETNIFSMRGLKVHNFYGSSECGGIAYDASEMPRKDGSCVGVPMSGVEVTINTRGCVEVRSAAVAEGYWPKAASTLKDGVFRTTDLGEIAGGALFLRGRASDLINVAGRKVAPEAIERALAGHPQVRECLVFGVPNASCHRGEAIVACVARTGDVTGEELRQHLVARLPAWQVPRKWWFVETLESNERGKMSRADWRKRYLDRRTTHPAASAR